MLNLPYEIIERILYFKKPEIKVLSIASKLHYSPGFGTFYFLYCVKTYDHVHLFPQYVKEVPSILQKILLAVNKSSLFEMVIDFNYKPDIFVNIYYIQNDKNEINAVYIYDDKDSFLWVKSDDYKFFYCITNKTIKNGHQNLVFNVIKWFTKSKERSGHTCYIIFFIFCILLLSKISIFSENMSRLI